MKIEIGENNALLVFLTAADVSAFGLQQTELTYTNEAFRRTLDALCEKAVKETDFKPAGFCSRVIELLPFDDGSLLICFSFKKAKQRLKVTVRRADHARVYEFDSARHLLLYSQALAPLHIQADVYENGGAYRLIACAQSESDAARLGEFSREVDEPFAGSRTREYWRRAAMPKSGENNR